MGYTTRLSDYNLAQATTASPELDGLEAGATKDDEATEVETKVVTPDSDAVTTKSVEPAEQ